MIDIEVNLDGTVTPSEINIGNKYENLDEELNFIFPEVYKNYYKYVIAYIKNKKTKESITRLFPIRNNRFVISSDITRISGVWNLYTVCKTIELDLSNSSLDYVIDLRQQDGEHIVISNAIKATINDNDIDEDVFKNYPMDENIKIIYDELIKLESDLEIAEGNRVGAEMARVEAENDRNSAEQERVNNENTRIENENNRNES